MNSFHSFKENVKGFFKSTKVSKNSSQKSLVSQLNLPKKNIYVTVLITESTASLLDLEAVHLQDLNDNYNKSSISLPVTRSLIDLITHSYSDKSVIDALHETDNEKINVMYTRIVDMEPSSTSTYELDDLSDLSKNDDTPIGINLKPDIVHHQSVMIINSVAHEDKLECDSCHVKIRTLNELASVTSSGWVNICRICHGDESTENLVAPCRCKGSVALAHMSCLEHWLKESSNSDCELCKHHFTIVRKPRFGFVRSILIWLMSPCEHGPDLLEDIISFCLYTPSALISTYILMLFCDNAVKVHLESKTHTAHVIAFLTIAGMAAIDFTYSSWVMMTAHKHVINWQNWYKENSQLTVILPPRKRKKMKRPEIVTNTDQSTNTCS